MLKGGHRGLDTLPVHACQLVLQGFVIFAQRTRDLGHALGHREAGTYRIHRYLVRTQLEGKGLGESHQGELGRDVGGEAGDATFSRR